MQLPVDFVQSIQTLLGKEYENLLSSIAEETPVSIRLNPFKMQRNSKEFSFPAEQIPWSQQGFYLNERPAFTFDPLFHSGYYYVQEASSMFIEYVTRKLVQEPVNCLDLCAAPGGKSVSLLSALPEGSFLVSNEIIRSRANILSENIIKFGSPNTLVSNNAPKDFANLTHFFDMLLIDAPCSGEGMFRKDTVAIEEWSINNVNMCAARQKDILRDVWSALKPGGLLIYSTCTYNLQEDEENARWIAQELGAEFVEVDTLAEWGISPSLDGTPGCYRFFPHKSKGEGLFVALLRKSATEECSGTIQRKKDKKKASPFLKDPEFYGRFLMHADDFDFLENDNHIISVPKSHSEKILLIREHLKTVSFGIEIGEVKGKDFIPAHALAMSTELNQETILKAELSFEEAIAYLRKEAIKLYDISKGYVLVTYKNEPLGFVKNLGNRSNNLYPQEWRIRSSYLPVNTQSFLK